MYLYGGTSSICSEKAYNALFCKQLPRIFTYPNHNVTLEGITGSLWYYISSCHCNQTFHISAWLPS